MSAVVDAAPEVHVLQALAMRGEGHDRGIRELAGAPEVDVLQARTMRGEGLVLGLRRGMGRVFCFRPPAFRGWIEAFGGFRPLLAEGLAPELQSLWCRGRGSQLPIPSPQRLSLAQLRFQRQPLCPSFSRSVTAALYVVVSVATSSLTPL